MIAEFGRCSQTLSSAPGTRQIVSCSLRSLCCAEWVSVCVFDCVVISVIATVLGGMSGHFRRGADVDQSTGDEKKEGHRAIYKDEAHQSWMKHIPWRRQQNRDWHLAHAHWAVNMIQMCLSLMVPLISIHFLCLLIHLISSHVITEKKCQAPCRSHKYEAILWCPTLIQCYLCFYFVMLQSNVPFSSRHRLERSFLETWTDLSPVFIPLSFCVWELFLFARYLLSVLSVLWLMVPLNSRNL